MEIVIMKPPIIGEDLKSCWQVRREVFIEEQGVASELEMDGEDIRCTHIVIYDQEQAVATARIRQTADAYKFERFAVLKAFRSGKLGELLVKTALSCIEEGAKIYLHAQVQVIGFYQKYGFVCVGEEFEEAGIKHVKMLFQPNHSLTTS